MGQLPKHETRTDDEARAAARIGSLFRAAMDASLDGFDWLEPVRDDRGTVTDFRILVVNAAIERLTGMSREAIEGRLLAEVFPVAHEGGFFEHYVRVLETGEPWLKEFPINAGNVLAKWLQQQVVRVGDGIAIFTRDLTERKLLEDRVAHAQRLDSIGRLAGGIAHDFNNLLTVIFGQTELARAHAMSGDTDKAAAGLAEIERAARRAAQLTAPLLTFARKQVISPRVVDVNVLVGETGAMVKRLLEATIDFEVAFADRLWPASVDAGQLSQVLVNLCVNARDAMPQGGKLTVETHNATLDEHYAAMHPDVKPGEYVLIAVTDTGQGIAPEVRPFIFEPFFTTKDKGTGLGLATSYGLVRQSGGHLGFYSEVGQGTTFKVYLPRHTADSQAVEVEVRQRTVHGAERILLVEDEDAVRELLDMTLSSFGYKVQAESSGEEALKWAAAAAQPPDLLITDVTLRGIDGTQVAQGVRDIWPALPVMYISGYAGNALSRTGPVERATWFLSKPFTPHELGELVRTIFDAPANA